VRRLLPLLLLLALALGACGNDSRDGEGTRASADADALLQRSLDTSIDSGVLSLELGVRAPGEGAARVTVEGPFESNGPTRMPSADLRVAFSVDGERHNFRLMLQRDNGYVEYEGETYEVGEGLWRQLMRESGAGLDPKLLELDPRGWFDDVRIEGPQRLDGVPTTVVSGRFDVVAAIEQMNRIMKRLPNPQTLEDEQLDELEDAFDDASFRAWIDDDDVPRRVQAEVEIDADGERARIHVDVRLDEPNQPQRITAPKAARPITELLRELGVPPQALLGPGAVVPEPG
jgi:hypothetical protein